MPNQNDDPKTFDILRMGREVEARQRLRGYLRLTSGIALVGLGIVRGRVLGVALSAVGLNIVTKHLTGRSIWQYARAGLAAPSQALTRKATSGNGLRDRVDEASWESFPASDPPGYYPGVN